MEEKKVKLTQKNYFDMLEKLAEENNRPDLVEFCQDRKAQIEKKANSSKAKASTNQAENDKIKNTILEVMTRLGRAVTVTELTKEEELNNYSNQKLSALLKQMVEKGTVAKIVDKKKSLFTIAE